MHLHFVSFWFEISFHLWITKLLTQILTPLTHGIHSYTFTFVCIRIVQWNLRTTIVLPVVTVAYSHVLCMSRYSNLLSFVHLYTFSWTWFFGVKVFIWLANNFFFRFIINCYCFNIFLLILFPSPRFFINRFLLFLYVGNIQNYFWI